MPRAINRLKKIFLRENIERLVRKKNALGFFSRQVFCFNIVTLGKGSKYREFYDLVGSHHMNDEPRREKTSFLHMRKQRRRSASL